MNRWPQRWEPALLLAAVTAVTPLSVLAQTEAVILELRLAVQDVAYYQEIGTSQMTFAITGGPQQTSQQQHESRVAVRVLDVGALGGMLVEHSVEDYRVTADGRTNERFMPTATFRVDPNGKIVERLMATEERVDYPVPLPGRPVRVGETWVRETTFSAGDARGKGTGTYTLSALGLGPDGRTARVRFVTEGTASSQTAPGGIPVTSRASVKIAGEYEWLVERGRLGRHTSETTMTADSAISVPGVSGLVRISGKVTLSAEPLSASTVTVPIPLPEWRINPGTGIGPFVFRMTAEEIDKVLGASGYRPFDLGFLAYSRGWRDGLVAYVSSDDNNTVLGFEVADPRYRTEKGTGVLSSRGAVLLAHGLSPRRLEMIVPGQGSIQVLVYDEAGVAFGVVSEANAVSRTITRRPIGRVTWVTVYPPGTANRIFPLPGAR